MKLFTAAEAAIAIGCDESTIRRQAARAWDTNGGPGPLAKHPSWQVVKRSAPEGGQGCGWMLARLTQPAYATGLGPAAQAVLEAYAKAIDANPLGRWTEIAIAAAIRALADHQTPQWGGGPMCHWTPTPNTRQELRNIAAEIESAQATGSTH